MILARQKRRQYDNVNVSFKDIAIYKLKVDPADQTASVSNARYFRDGPKLHPLKNSSAQNYFAQYKWCKINHASWYWSGFIMTFDLGFNIQVEQPDKKVVNYPSSTSIHNFVGSLPFYLTWDLDGHYQQKVSTECTEDDIHTRTLYLGRKKPVVFKWTVPQQLRRYINSDTIKCKPWDTDNVKDCFNKIDANEYRYPGWFNGSIGQIFDTLDVAKVGGMYPFEILLYYKYYVNCTFKGHTSN